MYPSIQPTGGFARWFLPTATSWTKTRGSQVSFLLPPPSIRAFIVIAHRVQHSHFSFLCVSIFIETVNTSPANK